MDEKTVVTAFSSIGLIWGGVENRVIGELHIFGSGTEAVSLAPRQPFYFIDWGE
jgi:hypothetical protein